MSKRKLDDKQERDVAISYLCSVSPRYIQETWGVCGATIRTNIIGKRSYEWDDALFKFYSETNPRKRLRNSAHLYLAFHNKEIPQKYLVDLQGDENIYKAVEDYIYVPKILKIIENTCLERFFTPTDGLEMLLNAIFYKRTPESIVEPFLVDRLYEEYQKNGEFSLERVCKDTEDVLIKKIKYGGIGITPRKAKFFYETEALRTLTKREGDVISLRFGLLDGIIRSYKEIGKKYGVTGGRIRQIEAKAIRKLRHPARSKKFKIIACLATDTDVDKYLAEQKEAKEREKQYRELYPVIHEEILDRSIEDLELSYRPYNCLKSAGIDTVGEAMKKTDKELLRIKNFGRTSLREVREVLHKLELKHL